LEGNVDGTGNVPGHPVDRFNLAAEALRRARID
jgi:hypothetical protein